MLGGHLKHNQRFQKNQSSHLLLRISQDLKQENLGQIGDPEPPKIFL